MRVLIVGLGKMGRLHASKIPAATAAAFPRSDDRDTLVGTVDPLCHAHYESIDQALAYAWDAAIIATPIATLEEAARATIARGIPTLVEKPGGSSAEQIAALADYADEMAVPVSVGWIERYNPTTHVVRECLAHYGDPVRVDTRRIGPTGGQDAMIDLAVHDFDLVRFLALDHIPHQLVAEYLPHRKERTMTVHLEDGCVDADFRARAVNVWQLGEQTRVPVPERDALTDELADFLRCVLTGRRAPCPVREAVAVAADVEAVVR